MNFYLYIWVIIYYNNKKHYMVIDFFELLNNVSPLRASAYMLFMLIFTFFVMNGVANIFISIFGKRPNLYVKSSASLQSDENQE